MPQKDIDVPLWRFSVTDKGAWSLNGHEGGRGARRILEARNRFVRMPYIDVKRDGRYKDVKKR